MNYVVVIPAKNEEPHIGAALRSILNQSIAPLHVHVVDDNSSDGTIGVIETIEQEYGCLTHHIEPSGASYKLGGHVVRLFLKGKQRIDELGIAYDWVVKMDADVECEADLVAKLASEISERKMGIVSGTPYVEERGRRVYDTSPDWHTHGQFKFYRSECFDEVGGPREHLGWDCADNIRAISAGWECEAFRNINYLMHRQVGGKATNSRGRTNHGFGCYICGFGVGYFALKVLHDVFKPPYVGGAIRLVGGYLQAALRREPKVLAREQRKLLRRLLWSSFWERIANNDFLLLQKLLVRKDS